MRLAPVFVVLGLALTAGCAAKPHCEVATIPASARDGAFLWRAQKGDDILWLYGTIHIAGLDAVPAGVLGMLDGSTRFVSELGNDETDRDAFLELARITSGPGIDQQLPPDDWYDLRDALLGVIKEDDLRRAQPWYAMTLLTTHLTPGGGPSMDILLGRRAADRHKSVEHLESWREQLTALKDAVKLADLQEAIHARKGMRCDGERMQAYYDAGDTRTMEALLVVPQTEATILTARNEKWLPALEGFKGATFVAVGLAHLLGAHGLPVLLRHDGYTVERVPTP